MHLCFVDESGTPAKPGKEKPRFFVMAGLVVPEDRWHQAAKKLQGLKTRRKYHGELKWRFFAPGNKDKQNPMVDWSMDQRDQFRDEAFEIVTSDKSIRIVAAVCEARAAYKLGNVSTQDDLYFRTYKVITERFQYLLQDITRVGGSKVHGIVVADHRGREDDERIRIQHQRLVEDDKEYTSSYFHLVEGLFLAPSHLSVGIQLADIVAGALWRRFEADDDFWYKRITSAFRTGPDGKVDGYGIARLPKKGWTGPVP